MPDLSNTMSAAWFSNIMMDPTLILQLDADMVETDKERAKEAYRINQLGDPLGAEYFPRQVWADENAGTLTILPDVFFANNYWVVSQRCADILREFNMGQGNLYPVTVLQHDRTTKFGGYQCLNFGNKKAALVAGESPRLRRSPAGSDLRLLPFVVKDDDVALSEACLIGPDLWIDTHLLRALFLSDALAKRLKAARLAGSFNLKRCKVAQQSELKA